MTNETLQTIHTRRSCRRYKEAQITDAELQTVLEAGTYAPTGRGAQSPLIVAVQDADIRQQLTRMNAAVMGTAGDPYYGAPTLVLVFAPTDCKTGYADGSLVLGTMMLAAHAIGLGSCWINREQEMFDTPEGQSLKERLGLPRGYRGVGALSLGHPEGAFSPQKPRKENYYRIIK